MGRVVLRFGWTRLGQTVLRTIGVERMVVVYSFISPKLLTWREIRVGVCE